MRNRRNCPKRSRGEPPNPENVGASYNRKSSEVLENEIAHNATINQQDSVSLTNGMYVILDPETPGLSKLVTISLKLIRKCWHLMVLVSTTTIFTL